MKYNLRLSICKNYLKNQLQLALYLFKLYIITVDAIIASGVLSLYYNCCFKGSINTRLSLFIITGKFTRFFNYTSGPNFEEYYTVSILKITGHKTEKAFLRFIHISKEDNALKLMEHPYFRDSKLKVV